MEIIVILVLAIVWELWKGCRWMWTRISGMANGPHIVPVDDLVDHVTDSGCVCGPTREYVKQDTGVKMWIVIHHSLDGREKDE